jgi:hypothetical protein
MPHARLLPAVAAAALLSIAGPSLAQQAGGPVLREATDDELVVQPFNKTVEDLEDAALVSEAGEAIGEIEEVLVDANGQPAAVTAEIGGFLGVGQRTVVIGLDRLQLKDDDLATRLTKEELEAMQAWGGQ